MKKIEKYNYKISDKILVNSLDAKKYLCKVYPEYKNKFIFNYNWSSFKRIKRIKYKKKIENLNLYLVEVLVHHKI